MRIGFVLAAVLGAASSGFAALSIDVGTHNLLPETPNQLIFINVVGGDPVEGLNLNAQIADGGPAAGGSILGPAITDADVLLNSIFSANNLGQDNPGSLPQLAARTVVTATGTVAANGRIVSLTIDTTGFETGTFDLRLAGTANGNTDFIDVPVSITNGEIRIVPEPMAAAVPFAAVFLHTRIIRRRQPPS